MPILNPLYPPNFTYGSDNVDALQLLLELPEECILRLLGGTPFEFTEPTLVFEFVSLRDAYGVADFAGSEPIIPVRHSATGTLGGYLPYCYVDTDEALGLGREPFGYPKKLARTELAVVGDRINASFEISSAKVTVDAHASTGSLVDWPTISPHLLFQVLPSAESCEPLLERVIARNTAAVSDIPMMPVTADWNLILEEESSELAFLSDAQILGARYGHGRFRSALGQVLETVSVGDEIRRVLSE